LNRHQQTSEEVHYVHWASVVCKYEVNSEQSSCLTSSRLHAIAAPHSWVKDLTVFLFDLYSGEDAYLKIRAGATLVQLYTAFAYEGPSMLPRIKVCLFLGKHQQCLLSTLRWSQVFLFFDFQ